jgi:hypothetical protein
MMPRSITQSHIDIADTLVRLYVFLAQSMDRCQSEAARISYPESELRSHLASTLQQRTFFPERAKPVSERRTIRMPLSMLSAQPMV